MSKQQKDPPCKVCGKTTGHECGRLVCGNRKQETAGGVLVDNEDNSVCGINPVEFWNTHERN